MELNVINEVAALQRLSIAQLRPRFADVFGEATKAGNRTWLGKRIVWRLQALAEGDLSERARRRAEELARDADLRLNAPQPKIEIIKVVLSLMTEEQRPVRPKLRTLADAISGNELPSLAHVLHQSPQCG